MTKEKRETGQSRTKPKTKNRKNTKEAEILMQEDKKLSKKDTNSDQDDENENEKTIELLLARNGWKYLVKWKNLSDEENSWEHWTDIPKRILNVRISLSSIKGFV